MAENNNKTYQVIITILVALLMFSMGFGASQLTMASDVVRNTTRLDNIEKSVEKLVISLDKLIEKLPSPKESTND